MSAPGLPPDVRAVAERVLTEAQLEAVELECRMGTMPIARLLSISRSAVRDRLHNAHTKLERNGAMQDASGRWYLERKEHAA